MPAVPFSRLYQEMEALYKPPHRRKSTWDKLRKVLQEFQSLPGVHKTSDITPVAIIRWVETHSHRAPTSNRSYLSAFRAAVKYARTMGYLRVDPWTIRTDWITDDMLDEQDEDDDGRTDRYHTVQEILGFLDLLDADAIAGGWFELRLQALGYTYALTGLRKSEALGLRVEDVDLAGRVIRLKSRRRRRLKTRGSAQPIGIPAELHTVLSRWLPQTGCEWLFPARGRKFRRAVPVPWLHGPVGEKALDEIKAAGNRAGIPNLTIQSFRRSIATHGRQMGLSLMEVRDQLRHLDARTTQNWYIEDDLSAKQSVADRISYRRIAEPAPAPAPVPSPN